MQEQFAVMDVNWFRRAHLYTGSIGSFGRDFRYRFRPDEAAKLIRAETYSNVCYELAKDVEERDFPWDEDGVAELKNWLEAQYEKFSAAQSGK